MISGDEEGRTEDVASLTAVILAGGLGTRLRPVVGDRPKVLAPIKGRPFLAYLLDQLASSGIQKVVLCTGYRGRDVRAVFGDRYGKLRLAYSQEAKPLGTGGALRRALLMLDTDSLLVMNGDSYCEADLGLFAAWHRARKATVSILLTRLPETKNYGRVEIDQNGAVVTFHEKSDGGGPGWINTGIYVIERQMVLAIPPEGAVSLERDVFPTWVGRGFCGLAVNARFLDIGMPASFAAAESFFSTWNKGGRLPGPAAEKNGASPA